MKSKTGAILTLIAALIVSVLIITLFPSGIGLWEKKNAMPENKPDDFRVVYSAGFGSGSLLDTGKGIYVADRVCEQPVAVSMQLSDDELEEIWRSVKKNDFFNLDLSAKCNGNNNCVHTLPEYKSVVTITAYDQAHAVSHFRTASLDEDPEYIRYNNITEKIDQVIARQGEYREEIKSLPHPGCAYQ